jgi:outer membrane protein, heavy metal efflux system
MFLARALGSVILLVAARPALAGDGEVFLLANDPEVSALVAEALERNPEVQSASAAVEAARQRPPQAAALPDPTVAVGYENGGHGWALGSDDATGLRFSVSQLLPGPGKRSGAAAVESASVSVSSEALRRARLEVTYGVRRAYADLLLARERLAILDDRLHATRDIEELTRSRYALGLAGMPDVLRTQAEIARLDQFGAGTRAAEARATAELDALRDRPAGEPVVTGTRLRDFAGRSLPVPPLPELLARLPDDSPAVAAQSARALVSKAALGLARRNLRPDFAASASYVHRGSMPPVVGIEFGLVLPAHRGRKQGKAVAEAEAQLRSTEALGGAVRLKARAAAEKGLADLRSQVLQAQALGRVLTLDALAVEAALASYRTGQVPFIAVLDAHDALFRDRDQQAEELALALRSSAGLDAWILDEQGAD